MRARILLPAVQALQPGGCTLGDGPRLIVPKGDACLRQRLVVVRRPLEVGPDLSPRLGVSLYPAVVVLPATVLDGVNDHHAVRFVELRWRRSGSGSGELHAPTLVCTVVTGRARLAQVTRWGARAGGRHVRASASAGAGRARERGERSEPHGARCGPRLLACLAVPWVGARAKVTARCLSPAARCHTSADACPSPRRASASHRRRACALALHPCSRTYGRRGGGHGSGHGDA